MEESLLGGCSCEGVRIFTGMPIALQIKKADSLLREEQPVFRTIQDVYI